jgi:hypothetical protein
MIHVMNLLSTYPNPFLSPLMFLIQATAMEYIRCQKPACNKSNPVKEIEEGKQYTCIFCGRPFTYIVKPETKVSEEKLSAGEPRIPDTLPVREPVDRNQRKPVNRNKRKPLR